MVTVQSLLQDPLLSSVSYLAGRSAAADRAVRWCSVMEWPVEDFVQPGEVVMTTAVGCDADRFCTMVDQIIASQAAALLVSPSPTGELEAIPPAATARAEAAGFPLALMPWEIRFSAVARMTIDRLVSERYGSGEDDRDALDPRFAAALRDERGSGAIADVAEQMLGREVIVLDAALSPAAVGALARRTLGDEAVRAARAAADERDPDRHAALQDAIARDTRPAAALRELGLPPGIVLRSASRRRTLGYVYAMESADPDGLPSLDVRVLEQAATAAAVELLRARAVSEAEARAEGDVLWAVARGEIEDPAEVARRTALLPYDADARYRVALGRLADEDVDDLDTFAFVATRLGARGHRELPITRDGDQVLLLVPPAVALDTVRLGAAPGDGPTITWGIADEPVALADLRRAYVRAARTQAVAVVLHGEGAVGCESELGAYLLLASLHERPDAVEMARNLLQPVVDYEQRTSRAMLRTLDVYLRSNGNASAAARDLYLNRHSLLYRLRKIESLTGRRLDEHDDRFLLEMSLRLLRMADGAGQAGSAGPPGGDEA